MKYHVMFTLEHGFSIEAMNLKEAETRAQAALKHMNEPTAKLLSVFVDGYVQGSCPDCDADEVARRGSVPKLIETEIDLDPSAA